MRLYGKDGDVTVTWGDHQPACGMCRGVDPEIPATYGRSCAQGGVLLRERLVASAPKPEKAPAQRRASSSYVRSITRYVGDAK